MMILCEKCGHLSFYDPYFKKYICESCNHREDGQRVVTLRIATQQVIKFKKEKKNPVLKVAIR